MQRGRWIVPPQALSLPPAALLEGETLAGLRDALESFERVRRQHSEALAEQRRLEAELRHVEEADKRALATALRQGAKDPGRGKVEAAEFALTAARRRSEALSIALDDELDALRARIRDEKAAWLGEVDARVNQARSRFAAAVEDLAAAENELAEQQGLRRFIHAMPEQRFQVGHATITTRTGEMSWSEQMGRLRATAAPPEAEREAG